MNVKKLIDKGFWAGAIVGTGFVLGFFLYPWVAYGATSMIDFQGYTVGDLDGQDGWTTNTTMADVVQEGSNKFISIYGTSKSMKRAIDFQPGEYFAIDLVPQYDIITGGGSEIRFCNDDGTSCAGLNAGFTLTTVYVGDYFDLYVTHAYSAPELVAANIYEYATTTLYFHYDEANSLGVALNCGFGCEFDYYAPYYATSTWIDDIDGIGLISNQNDYTRYDNIGSIDRSTITITDEPEGDYDESGWTIDDAFAYQSVTCDIGYDCRIEIRWTASNDGNVAYLMSENRAIEYDSIPMDGDTGRYDWFTVPASTSSGYVYYDILIENLNGYYTDELSTVAFKAYENVYVDWVGIPETPYDPLYEGVCADVCSDLATTSELTFWETFKDQIACGGRMMTCWMFTPGDVGKKAFKDLIATGQGMWPFSMISNATKLLYTTDQNSYGIVENENASTTMTLNGGVMFSTVSTTIPVLQTDMFEDFTILTFIKEKISMLLYVILFFFFFVRVMGSAWAPETQAIHPESQKIKNAYTMDLRSNRGDSGLRLDLRKRNY